MRLFRVALCVLISCLIASSLRAQTCCSSPESLASQKWYQWLDDRNEFPLAAWAYFSKFKGSPQEYRLYKKAGLNMVQAPLDQYQQAVDAGLNVLIGSWENLFLSQKKLNDYVKISNSKKGQVIGYMLDDEPTPDLFQAIGKTHLYIYQNDTTNALPMVDLLPGWAVVYERFGMNYETFIDKYIEQVHPAFLLNCLYPPLSDGSDRPSFYYNLELFRKKALQANIGMMGFALVTPHWDIHIVPSESVLKWQVYSYLCYGAKGMWYYNWRIDQKGFGQGLLDGKTAQPTPTFKLVQSLNTQLKPLGKILLSLESTAVYHTGQKPPLGAIKYHDGLIESLASFSNPDCLLGQFKKRQTGQNTNYLMIVNKRHQHDMTSDALTQKITFTISQDVASLERFDPDQNQFIKMTPTTQKIYELNIGGGHGTLLRFIK